VTVGVGLDPRVERMTDLLGTGASASLVLEPVNWDAYEAADQVRSTLAEIYQGRGWTPLVSAPIAFPAVTTLGGRVHVDYDFVDQPKELEHTALTLANALGRQGRTGWLAPGQPVAPSHSVPLRAVNAISAGLALPYQVREVPGEPWRRTSRRWLVAEELTDQVVDLAFEWTAIGADRPIYVEVGRHAAQLSRSDAERAVRHELGNLPKCAVFRFTDTGFRRVVFSGLGHVGFEIGGCDEDWAQALETLTTLLRQWAPVARYAMIRRSVAPRFGWPPTFLGTPLPAVYPNYYLDAPALTNDSVPDPYGVQLLTSRHLRCLDLDDSWLVQPVTDDKYLVTAGEARDWFDLGRPVDETLQRARQHFAAALITDQTAINATGLH
jgi:hypothetical protein